jgi:hypothetical protein
MGFIICGAEFAGAAAGPKSLFSVQPHSTATSEARTNKTKLIMNNALPTVLVKRLIA